MVDGIVKSLQQLGFTFKNPEIDDILSDSPIVAGLDIRFYTLLARINLKRLKQEGKSYLDYFRKLITENYHRNRVPDMEIYITAYFKAILDQIDVKISKDAMKPYRKALFDYYLKEKDALNYHFIDVFLDDVSKNVGSLRQVDLIYIYYVFNKAQNECRARCDQVFEENRHIEDVCKSFASFVKETKDIQDSNDK